MNQKIIVLLLMCCVRIACAEVYPNLDDPLERLVYGKPMKHYEEAAMREWKTAIASFPDANEKLLSLFERDYTQAKNWELLSFSMAALSQRRDLKSEDIDRIEKEMRAAAGQQNRSQLGSTLLAGGIPILVLHPTPDREALVARLARDQDWSVVLAALQSLVSMGSKEAKTEIENAVKRRRIPGKDQSLDWVLSEVTTLLSSFEVKAPPSVNRPPSVQPPAPRNAPYANPTVATPSEEPTSSTPLSIIVVLIVSATGLLWLLVKNRK